MPTKSGPYAVPEGGDDANVPGDMVALAGTIVPALTTAEIAALPWLEKPAGRFLAYDTTLGRLVRSTGAAMVALVETTQLDAATSARIKAGFIDSDDFTDGAATLTLSAVPSGLTGWSITVNHAGVPPIGGNPSAITVSGAGTDWTIHATGLGLLITGVFWQAVAY